MDFSNKWPKKTYQTAFTSDMLVQQLPKMIVSPKPRICWRANVKRFASGARDPTAFPKCLSISSKFPRKNDPGVAQPPKTGSPKCLYQSAAHNFPWHFPRSAQLGIIVISKKVLHFLPDVARTESIHFGSPAASSHLEEKIRQSKMAANKSL